MLDLTHFFFGWMFLALFGNANLLAAVWPWRMESTGRMLPSWRVTSAWGSPLEPWIGDPSVPVWQQVVSRALQFSFGVVALVIAGAWFLERMVPI